LEIISPVSNSFGLNFVVKNSSCLDTDTSCIVRIIGYRLDTLTNKAL